ncbi:MAG: TlpA family protein disulfide reductase [Odoribacteraceae bacterium]|jgi:thiol-disulfide isomerase/thioredoxin|nr:TlpA family protein disulfide reductase [Odoribacteraceae bacterium]
MKTTLPYLFAAALLSGAAPVVGQSQTEREKEGLRIHIIKDLNEKERAAVEYAARFLPLKAGDRGDPYTRPIISAVVQHRIAREGTTRALEEWLPVAPAGALPDLYYRVVQLPWMHRAKEAAALLPFSAALRDEMTRRAEDPGQRLIATDRAYTPEEWREECARRNAGFFFTHADLLFHSGQRAEALEVMEPLREQMRGSSEFNDLYARALSANGYRHLLTPFIEECAREDAATPGMLDTLRALFAEEGREGNFDDHVASLRSREYAERFEERLARSLIDRDAELFSLESMSGGRVDLSALKGKIIVLDFWSTWCAPCKAALPGMQVAVDRFADDPRVAFYFISTMEHNPAFRKLARDFITDKGYRLNILFDDTDPATGRHGAIYYSRMKSFGMNGIPHKLIFDGNGRLRWSSSGYHGKPLELANEITFLVNLLLAEQEKTSPR